MKQKEMKVRNYNIIIISNLKPNIELMHFLVKNIS